MRVLKVVAEGMMTSFRWHHFMLQIHPTFPMPPPTTIYGHICSALGAWFDPTGVQFAYHFTYEGQVTDMEHIHILSAATGKLPGTSIPKVLEGNTNPYERALLFRPRLILYLNQPQWEAYFRSPRYAVVLGRSQDLFTYRSVEVIEITNAQEAYFEHTLLPHTMALETGRGVSMLMPRWLDYERNRAPQFQSYLVLQERVHLPNDEMIKFGTASPYWIDPTTPLIRNSHRGVAWLGFDA